MSKTGSLIFPVFLPMQGCEGRCIYCDQNKISAEVSYSLEDKLTLAKEFVNRHPGQIKEIAFYGGSFTALPLAYREKLIRDFSSIADSCTQFRISTHPAHISDGILQECIQEGISCIELGIQDFCTEVLLASQRGYNRETALTAALQVKSLGFKLAVQLMPGLPAGNRATDRENQSILKGLKPDYLRLYPAIVIKGTELEKHYHEGSYHPLSLEEAIQICADYCEVAEEHGITVIKLGLPSNLSLSDVTAGPFHPSFGEFVRAELLVRRLLRLRKERQEIILDKKQQALLHGHNGKYEKELEQRLAICIRSQANSNHIT